MRISFECFYSLRSLSVFIKASRVLIIFSFIRKLTARMQSPLLSKFICCLELRTGGLLMGIIDCLLYVVVSIIFSMQIFFDVGFIENEKGERNLEVEKVSGSLTHSLS